MLIVPSCPDCDHSAFWVPGIAAETSTSSPQGTLQIFQRDMAGEQGGLRTHHRNHRGLHAQRTRRHPAQGQAAIHIRARSCALVGLGRPESSAEGAAKAQPLRRITSRQRMAGHPDAHRYPARRSTDSATSGPRGMIRSAARGKTQRSAAAPCSGISATKPAASPARQHGRSRGYSCGGLWPQRSCARPPPTGIGRNAVHSLGRQAKISPRCKAAPPGQYLPHRKGEGTVFIFILFTVFSCAKLFCFTAFRVLFHRFKRSFVQLLLRSTELVDQIVQSAIHHLIQVVDGHADAVVCCSGPGEIIGADLLTAVPRTHLPRRLAFSSCCC